MFSVGMSLVCVVVLLSWQRAWKTLYHFDFFFKNKKQGKVGKDLPAFCQAAVNLPTEPPALPYSHAVLVSGASAEAVTPRGLGASSVPGCWL